MSQTDDVNQGEHYTYTGKLEPIDVIEAFELGFHLGNATKYVLRHQHKDNPVKDLRKAIWYIARHLWVHYNQPMGEIDVSKPMDEVLLGRTLPSAKPENMHKVQRNQKSGRVR